VNYATLVEQIQLYTQNYETEFVLNIPEFVRQAEQRVYNTVQIPPLRKNVTGLTSSGNKYLSCPNDFLSVYSMAVIDGAGDYQYLLNKDVNFLREAYPSPTDSGLPKYYALFGPTVAGSTITNELSFIMAPTPDAVYSVELHYYYYPESIVIRPITGFGTINGGSGYLNGVYYNVAMSGGTGSGAVADIVVTGGSVTTVNIVNGGAYYTVGDSLYANPEQIGAGINFSVPVSAVGNLTGRSWLGDNYDPVLLYGCLVEAYIFMKGEQDMVSYYEAKFKEALGQLNRLGTGLERGDAYRDGQAKIKVNP
jgi:hypothetical protein